MCVCCGVSHLYYIALSARTMESDDDKRCIERTKLGIDCDSRVTSMSTYTGI